MNPHTVHLPLSGQPSPSLSHPSHSVAPSPPQYSSLNPSQLSDSDMDDSQKSSLDDITELLSQIEQYTPTIPSDLCKYLLSKSGAIVSDEGVKIISLAAQKFITDLLEESVRSSYATIAKTDPRSRTFKLDDLTMALREQGINIRKPNYFFQ
ncbi:hypothetical protein GEMRC1_001424 [Eukaryota sp. GEM-RC1]